MSEKKNFNPEPMEIYILELAQLPPSHARVKFWGPEGSWLHPDSSMGFQTQVRWGNRGVWCLIPPDLLGNSQNSSPKNQCQLARSSRSRSPLLGDYGQVP